jgi:acyl carrier protein
MENDEVLGLVLETIRVEAEDLGYEHLRNADAATPLYGGASGIDSLSLIRLIVSVESAAHARFGQRVTLADDRAMSMRSSPFRTAGTLASLLRSRMTTVDA